MLLRYLKRRNRFRVKKSIVNGEKVYIIQRRFLIVFWIKFYHTMEDFDLVYKVFSQREDADDYVEYLNSK